MRDISIGAGVELSGLRPVVAAGDLVVIAAILGAGMLRHGVDPLVAREHAALVIGPFAVGWIVAAPLVGAYTDEAFESITDATEAVGGTWVVAVLVGAGLRSTPYLPGNSPITFVAVVLGTGLVGIGLWRTVTSVVVN